MNRRDRNPAYACRQRPIKVASNLYHDLILRVERHPILAVFLLALVPRLAVALATRIWSQGSLFLDDNSYIRRIEGAVDSGDGKGDRLWETAPSFFRPLVYIGRLVDPDPFVLQSSVAVIGSLVAVLVASSLLLGTRNRRAAALGGSIVALFPSQILWSSLVLRDPIVWLGIAIASTSLAILRRFPLVWDRPRTWFRGVVTLTGTAASVGVAFGSRPHAGLLIFISLLLAFLFSSKKLLLAIAVVVLMAATIPSLLGFQPFGLRIIENGSRSFADNRAVEVSQAETPLRCFDILWFDGGDASGGGWENDFRCLPSSTSMFLTMPWPHQVLRNPSLIPPILELPLWLLLYSGALRNAKTSWNHGILGKFVLLHILLTIIFWSMVDRVVGTAFRHRGELLVSLVIACFVGRKPQKSRAHMPTAGVSH